MNPAPFRNKRRLNLLIVAVLLISAAGLRLRVAGDGLWVDELHTSWSVAGELQDVAPRAVAGNQSPLYFWLVWGVVQVAGHSVFTLRVVSLAAAVATVAAVGGLAWLYTRSQPAVFLAMLMAAFDRDFIFYATEARPYALAQCVSLAHLLLLSHALLPAKGARRDRLLWAGWAATGICMYYLHYTTALLLIAEAAAVAVLLATGWGRARQVWPWMLVAGVVAGAGCGLSAPHLLDIASRRRNWAMFIRYADVAALFELLHISLYVGVAAAVTAPAMLLRWRLLAAWQPRSMRACFKRRRAAPAVAWVLAICWLVVPLGVAWLCTNYDIARLWHYRYLVAAGAAPVIVASLFCASAGRAPLQWAVLGVVGGCSIFWNLPAPYNAAPHNVHADAVADLPADAQNALNAGFFLRSENWRDAIRLINHSRHNRQQPVLLYSGLIEADALLQTGASEQLHAYTLFPLKGVYRLKRQHALRSLPTTRMGALPASTIRQLLTARGCWLIVRGPPRKGNEVTGAVTAYLSGVGKWRIAGRHRLGGVTVVRLELHAPSDAP